MNPGTDAMMLGFQDSKTHLNQIVGLNLLLEVVPTFILQPLEEKYH
jgi:hypothetical protein